LFAGKDNYRMKVGGNQLYDLLPQLPRPMMKRVVIALLFVCATACDPPAEIITYVNDTAQIVLVYEVMGSAKTPSRKLAPAAETQDQVFVPRTASDRQNAAPRHFEATTEAGAVIFCAKLTYPQLDSMKWHVRITATGPCT
jgi:hypothetical protein